VDRNLQTLAVVCQSRCGRMTVSAYYIEENGCHSSEKFVDHMLSSILDTLITKMDRRSIHFITVGRSDGVGHMGELVTATPFR
jgi:hypothetical protein